MDKTLQLAENVKATLDKFVDTVKLKSHLASMDSKDIWVKIEKQFDIIRDDIRVFTSSIGQEKDELSLQGHLALMDAKERWEALREDVDQVVTSIGGSAVRKVDYARVKLSLAKLEARQLIDEAKHESHFQKLGDEVKNDWYFFLSKIDERVIEFINRFPLQ